jgi:hypothetical protein
VDTFNTIVEQRKTLLWEYGDVSQVAYSLTEFETLRTPFAAPSTLETVVRHNKVEMMASEFIVKCLQAKWAKLLPWFWALLALFVATYGMLIYVISKVRMLFVVTYGTLIYIISKVCTSMLVGTTYGTLIYIISKVCCRTSPSAKSSLYMGE